MMWDGTGWPARPRKWNPIATRKLDTIAAISLQAFTRHQNQRNRYRRPVPAPIERIRSNASLAVLSA